MKSFKKTPVEKVYTLLAYAIIAATIYILYMLTSKLLTWFSTLENQIAASIFTASAVALISTVGLILSKHYEHKREIIKEHNINKFPIYEELINFVFSFQFAEKLGKKSPSDQESIQFFAKLYPKLIVWGSEEVIKSLSEIRDMAANESNRSSSGNLFLFEKMLFNIRKDLGHKNKKLRQGDILSLFVTDIKNYLPHKSGLKD